MTATGIEAGGRGRSAPGGGWRPWFAALRKSFGRDIEEGRGFLWWPVAVATGAALYFAPVSEPSLADAAVAALGLAAAAAMILRRPTAPPLAVVLFALACLGFLHAMAMTRLASHPVFPFERTVTVKGHVVAVEDRGSGRARLRIHPEVVEPAPRGGLPPLVRVTTRGNVPRPGDAVTMLARLEPPMPPPLPGGYDFARVAWFSGVGASGFTYGAVKPWLDAPPAEPSYRLMSAIETVRLAAAGRIRAVLPGDTGAIAAALIVGDRAGISDATNEAMRVSGVSHVLSISGVHMSLVAAFLFGGLRLLMALVPPLALRLPIKKIAAALSIVGTGLYFVVSGMDVPAERSMIMVLVTLLAVILDRRALSLRVIAIAALVTLMLSPEAVVDPGAQMSFAAVVALMAGLEVWLARRRDAPDGGDVNPLMRGLRWLGLWLAATLLATLVAGFATLPMALYHFGRLAPLGMIANLLTEPLVSMLIMPAALVSALLMPLHLDALPLMVMGWGIDAMIAVAAEVAAWTPGGGLYGRPAGWTMIVVVAGGLWICLAGRRKRWLGGLPVMAGSVFALAGSPPDLLVSGDGGLALVRDAGGAWHKVGKAGGFTLDVWMAAVGLDPKAGPALGAASACDDDACFLPAAPGRPALSVVAGPMAFADDCALGSVVISAIDAPPWCRPSGALLDARQLARTGTVTFGMKEEDGVWRLRETGRVFGQPRRLWQADVR